MKITELPINDYKKQNELFLSCIDRDFSDIRDKLNLNFTMPDTIKKNISDIKAIADKSIELEKPILADIENDIRKDKASLFISPFARSIFAYYLALSDISNERAVKIFMQIRLNDNQFHDIVLAFSSLRIARIEKRIEKIRDFYSRYKLEPNPIMKEYGYLFFKKKTLIYDTNTFYTGDILSNWNKDANYQIKLGKAAFLTAME